MNSGSPGPDPSSIRAVDAAASESADDADLGAAGSVDRATHGVAPTADGSGADVSPQTTALSNHGDRLIGTQIDNKFEIVSLLGEGASGRVYKARHLMLELMVAIKILNRQQLDSETAIQRFKNEAAVLSSFKHPKIVKFLAYGITQDNCCYLVTELIEGQGLDQLLQTNGALTQERAVPIFKDICQGLAYAHSKGIVHRDIKPGNIMLSAELGAESAKILDFGLLQFTEPTEQKLTATGVLLGSANYMSPEHCKQSNVGTRSDIYSLGCVMYEALVGAAPMEDSSPLLIMQNQINKQISRVPAKFPLSKELPGIILRCLDKDPQKRFVSAEELEGELSKLLAPANKSPLNSKIFAACLLTFAFISVAVGIGTFISNQKHQRSNSQKHKNLQRPAVLIEQTLPQYEAWFEENVQNKQIATTKLVQDYCALQGQHRDFSVPGAPPGLKALLRRLKLEQSRRVDDANSRLAMVQLASGDIAAAQDTLAKMRIAPVDSAARSSDLNNALSSMGIMAMINGQYKLSAGFLHEAVMLMRNRGDLRQGGLEGSSEAYALLLSGDCSAAQAKASEALSSLGEVPEQDQFDPRTFFFQLIPNLHPLCKPLNLIEFIGDNYSEKSLSQKIPKDIVPVIDPADLIAWSRLELASDFRRSGNISKAEQIVFDEVEPAILRSFKQNKEYNLFPFGLFLRELCRFPDADARLTSFVQKTEDENKERALRAAVEALNCTPRRLRISKLREQALKMATLYEAKFPKLGAELRRQIGIKLQASGKFKEARDQFELALKDQDSMSLKIQAERLSTYNALLRSSLELNDLAQAQLVCNKVNEEHLVSSSTSAAKFAYRVLSARLSYVSGKKSDGFKDHQQLWNECTTTPITALDQFVYLAICLADEYVDQNDSKTALKCLRDSEQLICKSRPLHLDERLEIMRHLERLSKKLSPADAQEMHTVIEMDKILNS